MCLCTKTGAFGFLFCTSAMIIIVGAIALVLGLTLRFGGSPTYLMIYSAPPEDPLGTLGGESGQQYAMYIKIAAITLIIFGIITIILGVFGLIGACNENPTLLLIYAISVAILLSAMIVIVIAVAIFQERVYQSFYKMARRSLNESFDDTLSDKNSYSRAWFHTMQRYRCCGWEGPHDFYPPDSYSKDPNRPCRMAYRWACDGDREVDTGYKRYTDARLPSACCRFRSRRQIYRGSKTRARILDEACPINPNFGNAYLDWGCHQRLISYETKIQVYIILGFFWISLVLMLAIFAAFAMLRAVRYEGYDDF